jgi:hypothetical protein
MVLPIPLPSHWLFPPQLSGQEKLITDFVRILEGRESDTWDFLWGELGPPVSEMSWEEVALWLENLGIAPEAVDKQLREQSTGDEVQAYVETSSSDKEALQKVLHRSCALH